MLNTQSIPKDIELWQQLINQQRDFLTTRQTFLTSCTQKVELLKEALQNPTERRAALQIVDDLSLEERQSLLDELVKLSSVGHADIELVRKVMLSFPKIWLLNQIEKSAEPVLEQGTDEEYRRLLELYIKIDQKLTKRLIEQALKNDDPDIREAGEDFDNYLENSGCNG